LFQPAGSKLQHDNSSYFIRLQYKKILPANKNFLEPDIFMNRNKLEHWNNFGLWERWVLQSAIAQIIGLGIVAATTTIVGHIGYIPGTFTLVGILEGTVIGFTHMTLHT
jgi:hypothetical protein